jgi:hypothetical protein
MKRPFLALLCFVAAALAISAFVWAPEKLPPPVAFSAGDSAILHRLTCGTNHVAPKPQGWPLPRFARSWLFEGVELAGAGRADLNQEQERSGARLRLTQFTLRPPQNLNEPWNSEDASELLATLSRSPDATAHVDLAGVTDNHGQAHYPMARGCGTSGGSANLRLSYSFPTLPLHTRKITVTFVVQRGREFTFRVEPEIASSPVSLP